ncbi:MAG: hypothetical protein Fur007_18570 [Rhodoferax sp.]
MIALAGSTSTSPAIMQTPLTPHHTTYRFGSAIARLNASHHRARPTMASRLIATADGRLRLCGRIADVCAELDRLAAHEARSH